MLPCLTLVFETGNQSTQSTIGSIEKSFFNMRRNTACSKTSSRLCSRYPTRLYFQTENLCDWSQMGHFCALHILKKPMPCLSVVSGNLWQGLKGPKISNGHVILPSCIMKIMIRLPIGNFWTTLKILMIYVKQRDSGERKEGAKTSRI